MIFYLSILFGTLISFQALQDNITSFRIKDERIIEASGLACSGIRKGFFWIHNDSGDAPLVYLVGHRGKILGSIKLNGFLAFDWEDCAVSTDGEGKSHIWIGEIGNNFLLPIHKAIYVIREPDPLEMKGKRIEVPKKEIKILKCRFPGGPMDCECLMVHPKENVPYLVPKRAESRVGLYRWPGKVKPTKKPVTLAKIAEIVLEVPGGKTNTVTAGDFGPDGTWFALRCSGYICLFKTPAVKDEKEKGKPIPSIKPFMVRRMYRRVEGDCLAVDPWLKCAWICGEEKFPWVFKVPLRLPQARKKQVHLFFSGREGIFFVKNSTAFGPGKLMSSLLLSPGKMRKIVFLSCGATGHNILNHAFPVSFLSVHILTRGPTGILILKPPSRPVFVSNLPVPGMHS